MAKEKMNSKGDKIGQVGSQILQKNWSKNNRAQVTLFIIIAIVIVSLTVLFFLYIKPNYTSDTSNGPRFESCVKNVVEEEINILSSKAGFLSPEFTYKYQDQDFVYLCYTNEYYKTCTVQQPFLKQQFEDNLKKDLRSKIDLCYDNALDELKAAGYGVTAGTVKYDVVLEPSQVRIDIDAPTTVGSQSFKKFNVVISNPLYDTIMLATSIVQSEAHYGDSDTTQLMFYYPDYIVDKLKQGDGTTLYIIQNKLFDYKFQFASRSLAWPPGYLKQ